MQSQQTRVRDNRAIWPGHVLRANPYLLFLQYVCWIAGIAALGWFLFVCADTLYFQAVQARHLAAMRAAGAKLAQVRPGELLGKLSIPRIGLSAVVLEGDDAKSLRRAIGHIPGTSFPDGPGTVGLAGHRDTFFRNLGSLQPDDTILLETRNGTYRYRVATTKIVDPQNVEVLRPLGRHALALVTCYPFHFIGPAPRRFVVTAWEIPDGNT